MLERCVDPRSSKDSHLYKECFQTDFLKMIFGQVSMENWVFFHLSHPVANGKQMLNRLKSESSGFEGEAVEQGLLEGEVGRVERLKDVGLEAVACETWENTVCFFSAPSLGEILIIYHFGHVSDNWVESVM